MLISIKFFEKLFKSENHKDAYLKATKWVGTKLLKVEVSEITCRFTKMEDTSLPTIKLEIFVGLDVKDVEKRRCDACREFHRVFYINQDFNCNACNMRGYINELNQRISIKKGYVKRILKDIVEKDKIIKE